MLIIMFKILKPTFKFLSLECFIRPLSDHLPLTAIYISQFQSTLYISHLPLTALCHIFPFSSGLTSFFPFFMFPVDHKFWKSHCVHSLNKFIQNNFFPAMSPTTVSCTSIFPLIYPFVSLSDLETLADLLNISTYVTLILLLSFTY
jgi:hypothetical protein